MASDEFKTFDSAKEYAEWRAKVNGTSQGHVYFDGPPKVKRGDGIVRVMTPDGGMIVLPESVYDNFPDGFQLGDDDGT